MYSALSKQVSIDKIKVNDQEISMQFYLHVYIPVLKVLTVKMHTCACMDLSALNWSFMNLIIGQPGVVMISSI